jgi:hypothetical protein
VNLSITRISGSWGGRAGTMDRAIKRNAVDPLPQVVLPADERESSHPSDISPRNIHRPTGFSIDERSAEEQPSNFNLAYVGDVG